MMELSNPPRRIDLAFPGGKAKAFTLSYDDGVEQDVRLIELLRQYDLRGTFNLNSGRCAAPGTVYAPGTIHRRMTAERCRKVYADAHCEVAVHSLSHPFLETMPAPTVLREVLADRENLERQFGHIVTGMAYPFGTYSAQVLQALRMAGICYARTVHSTQSFALPQDWLTWDPTCKHTDEALPELTRRFVEETPQRGPMLFYVWGHAYEFERDDNWSVMETLCSRVSGRQDVFYATNGEICAYVNAYRALQWSVDETIAFNPTATELWCSVDGRICRLPSGAAVRLDADAPRA